MHIQEGTNTNLTTCTKMTEEVDRRHGVNGNSSKAANDEGPVQNSAHAATGGRLKFFKDGKFILELVRGYAREGERAGWVSVPRKTFWPPAAPPPTPPAPTHPPSALSVSDDNSSIQSSPWQRDHCWKQTTPRRNISKDLAMYYCRPNTLHSDVIKSETRSKRRRPYDPSHTEITLNGFRRPISNGVCDWKRNGEVGSDEVDGTDADYDREKYYHMKLKKPYQYHKLRVYKKVAPIVRRKSLDAIIARLFERIAALPVPVVAKLASCRQEHMIVSPRKRILRELERVSLETREDQTTKRRAKTVPALSTASYPPSPGPSHATHRPPTEANTTRPHNGTSARKEPSVTKNVSSYSIHSLLSMPDESTSRRSPQSYPPSLKTESPSSVHSPDLSPSPDSYRYRYSSVPVSGPAMESPPPAPDMSRYRGSYSPYSQYRPAPVYREVPYVYGYGYPPTPLYRPPPPPLWMQYAVPPGPWAPLAHPLLTDHIPKEEPTSDLPLNLSKH